jgi:SAM-dependent methyltransferase
MTVVKEARTQSVDNERAREQAQAQWNTNPCGAVPSEDYDREFFSRVEVERYRDQYWQKSFFDYESFRDRRVLEIGVGLGTDLKQFARNGAQCFGVDITETHLQLTRRNFELDGLDVDLRTADATKLPFPDGYFDCVYSFGVIHHIPDVGAVLAEVSRVLKPGGVFQVAVYHRYSVHTAMLFLPAVLNGQMARLGIAGVLSTIEKGADGVAIKPYVKLYSTRRLKRILVEAGLRPKTVAIRHVRFDHLPALNVFRRFERALGWYACAFAEKS